jgi:hypothetical protein
MRIIGKMSAQQLLFVVTLFFSLCPFILCSIPVTPSMRSFGHALKNAPLAPDTEQTAYAYKCGTAPCIITHINIPSIEPPVGEMPDWELGRIAFYIDEEVNASIDVTLLQLAAVSRWASTNGIPQDGSPFGIDLFGKPAADGGIYCTIRIPFQSSVRITLRAPPSATRESQYFLNVRGVESAPVQLGEFVLPNSAKLRAERHENVGMAPLEFLSVMTSTMPGALLLVQFDGSGQDFSYLEACVRATLDGQLMFLSSGMEDYFLSAFYFDEGRYITPNAGLTYMNVQAAGLASRVGAYKTHTRDVIFWKDSMQLIWRYGEQTGGCGNMTMCPNTWCGTEADGRPTLDADEAAGARATADAAAAAAREQSTAKAAFSFEEKKRVQDDPDKGAFSTIVWLYEWKW